MKRDYHKNLLLTVGVMSILCDEHACENLSVVVHRYAILTTTNVR
jgi:hypothetical protein